MIGHRLEAFEEALAEDDARAIHVVMGMPVLSSLVMKAARRLAERGVRNLVALAEERRISGGS